MKLLLTSAGLTNKTISDSLFKLVGKLPQKTSVLFIPTATENIKDKWLNRDLENIRRYNVESLEVVDISVSAINDWIKKLEKADILFFGGGDTYRLMYWITKSGLQKVLTGMLKDKVYAGISAGSCVTGPKVDVKFFNELFPEEKNEQNVIEGLDYVDFYIIPHLNSYSRRLKEDNVRKVLESVREKVYVIDDQCALEVIDDKIKVIGEGKNFQINV